MFATTSTKITLRPSTGVAERRAERGCGDHRTTASAVTHPKCNLDEPDANYYKIRGNGVNFRKGPSTKYGSYGLLSKGTKFTYYCTKTYPEVWWYGKVTSGPHQGQKGWVRADFVTY
ncbi:SH3 domain-containing protein [Streptomyces sp. NPDC017056]|uniref:SH3 domain-containing protein n=1 Tax=Streptomyces sp. NPDC017056 TaxID=3364973 RepID=UPI0037B04DFC